jgi:hypothetical protein
MKQPVNQDLSRELDQFYTDPKYASHFLDIINTTVDLSQYSLLLEPSAGTGSFFNIMDPNKRVGLDLDPKADEIIKTDFFDWIAPHRNIATIGNPPFGKNAGLAVKFFNHAATFSKVIAFVIPRTFRKASVINRLNENFHLVYDETVPDNSFIFKGNQYDVWCCAQIWIRKDEKRKEIPTLKFDAVSNWFEKVSPAESDFSVQRVGGKAGTIRTEDFKQFSSQSHFYFKAHDPRVIDVFRSIDFDTVKFNTAGNPSVSPSELIEMWLNQAKKLGVVK